MINFSSSRSQTSSDTSRSPSPSRRRRYDSHQSKEAAAAPSRYNNKSPGRRPHHGKGARSPTPKRRHSPGKQKKNILI